MLQKVLYVGLLLVLLLGVNSGYGSTAQETYAVLNADGTVGDTSVSMAQFANCRVGATAWKSQQRDFNLISNFGLGLYQDFSARTTSSLVSQMADAEHVQMLRLSQTRPNDPVDVDAPVTNCGPDYGYSVNYPLHDNSGGLGALVAARRGALWIVGNEPDRRLAQDDICPQQYAEAYHDIYYFIKQRDPSAQVAVAGLVEITPGRLQYLDIVRDTYLRRYGTAMPVDVWTMHVYILSETGHGDAHVAVGTDPALAIPLSYANCADPNSYCHAEHDDINIFITQVRMMRQWMKDRGYQNTPLLLTEFGILLPYHYYGTCYDQVCPANPPADYGCFCDTNGRTFHPQRVADFAKATFAYLLSAKDQNLGYVYDDYRLVQQFIWYSVESPGSGQSSNLIKSSDISYSLTIPGQWWKNYVPTLPREVNLFPKQIPSVIAFTQNDSSLVTVTLAVEVWNNGNSTVKEPAAVTFYRDAALSQPIGSTTLTNLGGCARDSVVVTTTWSALSVDVHPFWVKIDSNGVIPETNEADNAGQGIVIVNPSQIYLPMILLKR